MKKRARTLLPFQDKVVIITGGASGIGAALARAFAAQRARIALLDSDPDTLAEFTKALRNDGKTVFSACCDVSRQADCDAAIRAIIDHWGQIDILINNAGITQRGNFTDTAIPVFKRVMDINFYGALYCTKTALPAIRETGGAVVIMESIAGVTPLPGRSGYCASKHALHGLFTTLRTELKPSGVHIMNVCPGFIKTRLQSRALGPDGSIATQPRTTVGKDYTPDMVAARVLQGLERRTALLALTPAGKLAYWLNRISPPLFEWLIARQMGRP